MDTNAPKLPDPLPFAAWQRMAPQEAAREVHRRLELLPLLLRRAALAWLCPEAELANQLGASRSAASALRGIPYLLKDLFDLAGVPTFAGSTFLPEIRGTPTRSSALIDRLQEQGAACAAKTHLVEFASGLTGENPHYGDCPHPRFPDRLAGGSSSGSAALVAAGVAPLAIGTDTGGSVRVPAAWCGLYGFRLTPRDPFIADAFPLSPTLDTAGWFTATPADLLVTWRLLAASPSMDAPPSTRSHRGCFLDLREIVPGADPTLANACHDAASVFSTQAPADVSSGLVNSWSEAVDGYLTIAMSEAHTTHRHWLQPYRDRYDPVVWQRFNDAGALTSDRIAAARATRERIAQHLGEYFKTYDFLVVPTVPTLPPRKIDATPHLRRNLLALNSPASLAGLPVLSIPVSLPDGFSAGLQVLLPDASSDIVPWLLERHTPLRGQA